MPTEIIDFVLQASCALQPKWDIDVMVKLFSWLGMLKDIDLEFQHWAFAFTMNGMDNEQNQFLWKLFFVHTLQFSFFALVMLTEVLVKGVWKGNC